MDLLPPDLQFLIQSFLDPSDIISLRMTCKSCHASSRQRAVWIAALRRVCIDQGVFMPSFPLGNMSVEELEHAALSPSRLVDRMRNGSSHETMEPRTRRPLLRQQRYNCDRFLLIPGGRFLFTSKNGCISLWDLGNVGTREKIPSLPVAVISDGRLLMDSCPTADGTGILLSTCHYRDDRSDLNHVVVYEIYPSALDPQFTFKGELKLIGLADTKVISGGRFAFLDIWEKFLFWDLATNDFFTWQPQTLNLQEMFLVDHYLITLSDRNITMWEIPFFRGLVKDECDDSPVPSEPKLKQTLVYPSLFRPRFFSVPSPWWPTSRDITFGVAPAEDTSLSKMAFYRLELGPKLGQDRPINRVGTASSLSLSTMTVLSDLRVCNNDICQRWRSRDEIIISVIATPTQTNGFESDCAAITKTLFRGPTQDVDFCSVSGRLLVSTKEDGVSVMDFVAPTNLASV